MAVNTIHSNDKPIASIESDYGSDISIDDATATALFIRAGSQSPLNEKEVVLPSIGKQQQSTSFVAELEGDVCSHNFSVRLAKLQQSIHSVEESRAKLEAVMERRRREARVEVEYEERNRRAFSPSNPEEPEPAKQTIGSSKNASKKDSRSPLQRFKSRRPLSVTNLVSPSWCEQQYEYNLNNYGRIPQTKAMTAGTTIHKELEEQVHVEVPVEVVTREDRHGLKMWNTIQGLRALRETGLTRELEIWGVLEGEVVNGIIDEVTIECPDPAMEERILKQMEDGDAGGMGKKEPQLAPDQRTLEEYLTGSQGGSVLENNPAFLGTLSSQSQQRPPTYYLTDVKTTKRTSPPANPAYTRGAHIQLMIYHRILSTLSANEVSAQQVFDRYHLDSQARFSDKFNAELANLDMRAFVSVPDEVDMPPSQRERDPLTELLEFNTLASLWTLMVTEMQRTFLAPSTASPAQQSSHATLSSLLTVEYRSSSAPSAGADALIGRRSFPFDAKLISSYVQDEIKWWRGQRPTVGVSVEDAWKCGWCEFAGECAWREEKVEEGFEKARLRREGLGKSGV